MTERQELCMSGLRKMTTEQIQKGLRAFKPTRSCIGDCFIGNAFGEGLRDDFSYHRELAMDGRSNVSYEEHCALSSQFEVEAGASNGSLFGPHLATDSWLRGECVRELMERGTAKEPALGVEELVGV